MRNIFKRKFVQCSIVFIAIAMVTLTYFANATTAPTITNTSYNSSEAIYTWTVTDTAYYPDSLVFVFSATAADSDGGASGTDLEQAASYVSDGTITVTGLKPFKTYYVIARADSEGDKAYTARDTINMNQVIAEPQYMKRLGTRNMIFASTPTISNSDLVTATTLNGTAADSTVIYSTEPYNGFLLHSYQANDSIDIDWTCYAGFTDVTVAGGDTLRFESVQTGTITAVDDGTSLEIPVGCPFWYLNFTGGTDNGYNTYSWGYIITNNFYE